MKENRHFIRIFLIAILKDLEKKHIHVTNLSILSGREINY